MADSILFYAGVATLILAFVISIFSNMADARWRHQMASERAGESICQFVRALPYRQLDTAVIRAVYEEVQRLISSPQCQVPIRASDDLTETLRIDIEDLEDTISELADRCGRSLEQYEQNPFYLHLYTAGDLVRFLCAQPRVT